MVNPGSLILSGAFLLDYLGWKESSALIRRGLEKTIQAGIVTYDLARQISGAKAVKGSEFGQAVIQRLK